MAAFARKARSAVVHTFHLYPEHQAALWLWLAVQTQWREGFSGPTGLDYAGVESHLRVCGIRGADRRERWAELQTMERAALLAWKNRRK
jgi:hypothetical protein